MTHDPTALEVERALAEQMVDAEVQSLPSSMCRQRGLVWLEGWFDIPAALSQARDAALEEG